MAVLDRDGAARDRDGQHAAGVRDGGSRHGSSDADPRGSSVAEWPTLRELPTICVDSAEFVVSKLKDRGTHQAFGVVTNAQDFMHILRLYVERELVSRSALTGARTAADAART